VRLWLINVCLRLRANAQAGPEIGQKGAFCKGLRAIYIHND